ncbi:MAG TPA: proton-conducting transporter membrane subunit, partial [Gemmatimonadaceae bacterium]
AGLTVALVGGLTALFAATIGLKQWDIKKVLAYSTVSQLGYMFVGVGVGAYAAGMFHVLTHAFFKALLFLGSGSVIFAMHAAYHGTHNHSDDAQDMRNMGGLKSKLPVTWILMWIATLAIAGVPVFSGFVSKDAILGAVFERAQGSTLAGASLLGLSGSTILYAVYVFGLAGALLTAIYMTRMMLYTFHGPNRTGASAEALLKESPWIMTGPLVVLGILSAVGGWLNLPEFLPLGPQGVFDKWLAPVLSASTERVAAGGTVLAASTEQGLVAGAVAIAIAGIAIAVARLKPAALVPKKDSPASTGIDLVLENKYYVDEAYDRAIVQPVVTGSRLILWKGIDVGIIDGLFVNGAALLARATGWLGSQVQSGQLGTYAWVMVLGVIALLSAFVRIH